MAEKKDMKSSIIFLLAFVSVGCASKTLSDCPAEIIEPVSTCRAEVQCGKGKFMTYFAIMLSGAGAGSSGRNQAMDNYNQCIENNLDAQRSNAGIQSTTLNCTSTDLGGGMSKTVCH